MLLKQSRQNNIWGSFLFILNSFFEMFTNEVYGAWLKPLVEAKYRFNSDLSEEEMKDLTLEMYTQGQWTVMLRFQ